MKQRYRKSTGPKIRKRPPKLKTDDGKAEILCPFCFPSHPIQIEFPSSCGTILELSAIQSLYKDVTCALCGGARGSLVKIGEKYKHAHDCTPGQHLYAVPPKKSRGARAFWYLPNFAHTYLWRVSGRKVIELSNDGKVTGYRARVSLSFKYES